MFRVLTKDSFLRFDLTACGLFLPAALSTPSSVNFLDDLVLDDLVSGVWLSEILSNDFPESKR